MVNLLFDAVLSYEPIDCDVALLADAQSALCCLHVYHGVPVGVKDYHFVGSCQVDTQTPDTRSQQKHSQAPYLVLVLHLCKAFYDRHPLLHLDIAIKAQPWDLLIIKHSLYYVEHLFCLAEKD